MPDRSKEKSKRPRINVVPQHEADARVVREKMARLRELRLAHEAATGAAQAAAGAAQATDAPAAITIKKKSDKSGAKRGTLSDWLATQQRDGRRS